MPENLMFLEHAVELLADVAAGEVTWLVQRSATYAINGRTGRRCTKTIRDLAAGNAVRHPSAGGRCELTDSGRDALAWHRGLTSNPVRG